MKKVEKRRDTYAIKSAEVLKEKVRKEIKNVFKKALVCVEIKFGKDFDGYAAMRAEILRAGNDAIRNIDTVIDGRFNIESVPDVLTFIIGREKENKEGSNV